MAVIKVPKPPRSAINKDRLISSLLKSQIAHLQEVEKQLPPEQRTGVDINSIKTEGQAAEYIREITAVLHPQAVPQRFDIAAQAESVPVKPGTPADKQIQYQPKTGPKQ